MKNPIILADSSIFVTEPSDKHVGYTQNEAALVETSGAVTIKCCKLQNVILVTPSIKTSVNNMYDYQLYYLLRGYDKSFFIIFYVTYK